MARTHGLSVADSRLLHNMGRWIATDSPWFVSRDTRATDPRKKRKRVTVIISPKEALERGLGGNLPVPGRFSPSPPLPMEADYGDEGEFDNNGNPIA